MKTMTYKGYTAKIIYSDEDECFVGHIVNIDAISGFHGDTDEELHAAFEDMVDLYIEVLEERKTRRKSMMLVVFGHAWSVKFIDLKSVTSVEITPSLSTLERVSSVSGKKILSMRGRWICEKETTSIPNRN